MPLSTLSFPPAAAFWDQAAEALVQSLGGASDMSGLRVLVPGFMHVQLLKQALLRQTDGAFVPPRIGTLSAWRAMLPPERDDARAPAEGARLVALYAELRRHAWLKKLFSARRNTDLLPLAQLLLTLCDELTGSLLPEIWQDGQQGGEQANARWRQALEQLPPSARHTVSDEAQLVWSIWKTQLDGADPLAMQFAQNMRLARQASETLAWVAPESPDPFEQAFLNAYAERNDVLTITEDFGSVNAVFASAWPELIDAPPIADAGVIDMPSHLALCPADGMEQEAQQAAQTIVGWLQQGKSRIAVVVQDRVVARRLRALLERAQVFVADETGWKLSTTRAASAVSAWFDAVATRGETAALLDLLKSPFAFSERADKEATLIGIEIALRNANVAGGWEAIMRVINEVGREPVALLAREAGRYDGRKSLAQWSALTESSLTALGVWQALTVDAAGKQVVDLLRRIATCGTDHDQMFSLAEWRAFVALQMESTSFLTVGQDKRVVMLTLGGARLRSFDAVWVLGCDADRLPAQSGETLFFANAVRRELGLSTRESRQRRQLRDLAALLCSNGKIVLSWQTHRDGEPNPLSPWIGRLQLTLERQGKPGLRMHDAMIARQRLTVAANAMPAPAAPHLLPSRLSASGYNSLVACPYQFFATRMLGLSGLEELSDMPEKRDYGQWLHRILNEFHETLLGRTVAAAEREALLRDISAAVFEPEVADNAAALGYYVRWRKAMPAYLDWVARREADGWQFSFGERKFEKVLQWEDGSMVLHGRIDRVDHSADGESALLDYKTKNAIGLRDKLKQGEDRQLAFYGMLAEEPFARAHYVALEPSADKIDAVEKSDFAAWQQRVGQQVGENMQALAHGAALPATGVEAVCAYCTVRGLCRKGAW